MSRPMICAQKIVKSISLLLLSLTLPAKSEVVFDGSFGHTDLRSGDFLITESDGKVSGNNLFHSFDTFNVQVNESATFTANSANIQTIIGRVTGSTASVIDGTIRSDINLWIANPNGVLVGVTALFDGTGIIQVQAADTVNFDNGDQFRVRETNTSSLSIASPDAFGFVSVELTDQFGGPAKQLLTDESAADTIEQSDGVQSGSNLFYHFDKFSVYPSQSLEFNVTGVSNLILSGASSENSLINGPITVSSDVVTDLWFTNPNGLILGATGAFNIVGALNLATATSLLLENDVIWTQADAVPDSPINFATTGTEQTFTIDGFRNPQSADIRIVGGNIVEIKNGASITSINGSTGLGGSIDISGLDTTITDSTISSSTISLGDAGAITIQGDEAIYINNSQVLSESYDGGSAGNISVSGGAVTISGTTLFAESNAAISGNAGQLEIDASSLTISNSTLGTGAFSLQGNAGSVVIQSSENVTLNNTNITSDATPRYVLLSDATLSLETFFDTDFQAESIAQLLTEITPLLELELSTTFTATDAQELSAQINLLAGSPELTALNEGLGAELDLLTLFPTLVEAIPESDGGFITVTADSLNATDSRITTTTSSMSDSLGFLEVTANDVTLINSELSSNTTGPSNAGYVLLNADTVTFSNSRMLSESQQINEHSSTGAANYVRIDAKVIELTNNSEVGTNSFGTDPIAEPGLISLNASEAFTITDSRVAADTYRASNAGSILLTAPLINANNSMLVAESKQGATGASGAVHLTGANLILTDSLIGTETASVTPGLTPANIVITATEAVQLLRSTLSADTLGGTNAGDIFVTSPEIQLVSSRAQSGTITTATGDAGNVFFSADTINISETSSILSDSLSLTGNAGRVNLSAINTLILDSNSRVATNTTGLGNAGDLSIQAGILSIIDSSVDSNATVSEEAMATGLTTGSAGAVFLNGDDISIETTTISTLTQSSNDAAPPASITIIAEQNLAIVNSNISADTEAQSNAGNISLLASGDLVISETSSVSSSTNNTATGNAGSIFVNTSHLNVDNAQINSDSNSFGDAGEVSLAATESLTLQAGSSVASTSRGTGNAGDISVNARSITVDAAVIESDAILSSDIAHSNPREAGVIDVSADQINLSSATISTQTASLIRNAAPASVTITATDLLSVVNATINADTTGAARAGDVVLSSDVINISGSNVFAESLASGDAGNVRLFGQEITATDNTVLASRTLADTEANAGTLVIIGDRVQLLSRTDASTTTFSRGDAGDILIQADILNISSEASVSSESTGIGDSGGITLDIGTTLTMENGNVSTNSSVSMGGDILIQTRNSEVVLRDSEIRASAGAGGNGGNIFVETDLLLLDSSDILAEAAAGNGGFINIDGKVIGPGTAATGPERSRIVVLQDFGSRISADSDTGTSGTVNIEAPSNDVSALVAGQNADTLVVPSLANNRCEDHDGDRSRLTSKAPGDVRLAPEGHLSVKARAFNASASTAPPIDLGCPEHETNTEAGDE